MSESTAKYKISSAGLRKKMTFELEFLLYSYFKSNVRLLEYHETNQ
jgi:hypothetical protein